MPELDPFSTDATADGFAQLQLDATALRVLSDLDPTGQNGLLPRIFATFLSALERQEQDARSALAEGRWDEFRRVAHTLKSSSASIGALELSRLCADCEQRVREGDTAGLPEIGKRWLSEVQRARTAVQRLQQEKGL